MELKFVAAPLNPELLQTSNFAEQIISLKISTLILPSENILSSIKAHNLPSNIRLLYFDQLLKKTHLDSLKLREASDISTCLLLQTSGTTSKPKIVPLSYKNIEASSMNISKTYSLTKEDVCLLVMPLFHVHGLIGCLLATSASGGSIVVPEKFSARHYFSWINDYGITWSSAVPSIYQIMLNKPFTNDGNENFNCKNLRFLRSCSSTLLGKTFEDMHALLKSITGRNVPLLQAYAMTETCHQMTSNPLPGISPNKMHSVGKAQGTVQMVILRFEDPNKTKYTFTAPYEIGEVAIVKSGPTVTKGYLENPAENSKVFIDDYFLTGDLGYFDNESYLFLTGRSKEIIVRGGEKISPAEIDELLMGFPSISQAVTFGLPNEIYGQEIYAVVVLKDGSNTSEIDAVVQWLSQQIPSFKIPKKMIQLPSLPLGPTGKVQRLEIARYYEQLFLQQSKI